ncbi:MAG: gluconokinase [Candidatus Tectomicrobia bacterium]|nr:gluconokinase [Candidatus Tectomicrobia bacterium]
MVVILMGVTASGKTTVGRLLAEASGYQFYDADDFHPSANVDKMRRGIPLDDDDRRPWLETLRDLVRRCLAEERNAVLACSALKQAYRRYLLIDPRVKLAYLKVDEELIRQRLQRRQGHFMNPALLESQFTTLEEPDEALWLDASRSPEEIVGTVRCRLQM